MTFNVYLDPDAQRPAPFRELDADEAERLFGAMLDGGLTDLELGVWAGALASRPSGLGELLGLHAAISQRLLPLHLAESAVRPVVIPSYGGAQDMPNLMPLLAMLLHRFEIPVLIHGSLQGNGRVAGAYVLRELGVLPSITQAQAEQQLTHDLIAFVPTAVVAPGLATLLALAGRTGLPHPTRLMSRLLQPLAVDAVNLVPLDPADDRDTVTELLHSIYGCGLLFAATEGEAFVEPHRRPQIDLVQNGSSTCLFAAEHEAIKRVPGLPTASNAVITAQWIKQVLAGERSLPIPIVNQLACCLYATGYAPDMNQAKAIVAVETGSLAA